MAREDRWQDEDRFRRERERQFDDQYTNARRERELLLRSDRGGRDQGTWRGDDRFPRDPQAGDYGRDYGAPYRGRGYERDEESRSGEYYGSAGYNAVNSYGTNYGNAYDAGRSARGDERGRPSRFGREDRNWWDRATDEVSAWFGDDDAQRRRVADQNLEGHRGRGPKGYARSDERIREEVCDRLSDDPFVDASDIEVSVAGGEVTLTGTADSRDERRRAEDCAERVSGVSHVQNNVRVSARLGAAPGTGHPVTTSSTVASPARSATGLGSASDPYTGSTPGSGSTGGSPAVTGSGQRAR